MSEDPQPLGYSRIDSFAIVGAAYLVAAAVGLWTGLCFGSERPLLTLFLADVAATVAIWAFSMAFDNGSFYDAFWSVAPPFFVAGWIAEASHGTSPTRQAAVAILVLAWALRLTWNWARGWPGLHHEDWRYPLLYERAPMPKWASSLLGVHVFPTIQVFLGSLALVPALARGTRPFGRLDVLALVITAGAILVELVADEQMRAFARGKERGAIMDRGLWAWSRHPNYFGELGFWWGLWLFGIAAAPGWWWTIVGPLAMTAMFLFASIPMLDERSAERRPGYAEHMRRVSALLPLPPRT